ncbi:tetratricopeptide repeat protein [Streptomyces sp. NPDC007808]|uniref:tetratricopeptide repeat protein n=1 Tax=Streptomyces sp. NPDC007808 TaxID=3364779 RepID=UPI00367B06E0
MSLLSRAMKREHKRAAATAAPATAPIDVRVPAAGPGAGGASVGGVPVTAAPGEEIQHAVLTHLQRIAVACGHPVHATIHDERIGYVVPLRVDADGSSHYTADPVRTAPPAGTVPPGGDTRLPTEAPARPAPAAASDARMSPVPPAAPDAPVSPVPPAAPDAPVSPASAHVDAAPSAPYRDRPTHRLRPLPGPEEDGSPTFRLRTTRQRERDAMPGSIAPPLGEFGPPPLMDAGPQPAEVPPADPVAAQDPVVAAGQVGVPGPVPAAERVAFRGPSPAPAPFPEPGPIPAFEPAPVSDIDPDPEPSPPRGFDAVAEAVLGDAPGAADASPFAAHIVRINEAVAQGRTAEAAERAERAVAEASAVLGPEHAEVLRMRELAAYIAYLAGDPAHAFRLSLDVARAHHRARATEAAYSSIHGAATAWRAVRDPALGLDMGRDLLGLWTDLAAGGGPAAEDVEELESVRARMDRLAARAARPVDPHTG